MLNLIWRGAILSQFSQDTLDGISTVTGRVEALLQFLCFLVCPLYQEIYTSGEVRDEGSITQTSCLVFQSGMAFLFAISVVLSGLSAVL